MMVSRGDRFRPNVTESANFQAMPDWVRRIAHQLTNPGFQAFLVGGAVRDLLWGEPPHDWDLATDALPDRIEAIFPHTVPTGKRYGTITVLDDGNSLEVTTFREDLGYSDGRRPDAIRFGSDIRADLGRRDFTVNALAYDFRTGELVDPYQGYRDLKKRLLRAVGEPRVRFAEDGLRMFRFYRFLATCDLRPDPATRRAVDPEFGRMVSLERIRDEFSKLLLGRKLRIGLNGLRDSGLLGLFLPELAGVQLPPGGFHRYPLWEHLLVAAETIRPELQLRLAALLHDIAKPLTRIETETGVHYYGHDQRGAELARTVLERLRYPGKLIEAVTKLVRWHMFLVEPHTGDAAIRRLIAKVGPELVPDLLELRRADLIAVGRVSHPLLSAWEESRDRILGLLQDDSPLRRSALAVGGRDLIETFHLAPGPAIGRILDELWNAVLDDPARNDRQTLLRLAETLIDPADRREPDRPPG